MNCREIPLPEELYQPVVNGAKYQIGDVIEETLGWCGPVRIIRSAPADWSVVLDAFLGKRPACAGGGA
jgi:hypothetical protein